jgi:hypothetical protein
MPPVSGKEMLIMGYTHFDGISVNKLAFGAKRQEIPIAASIAEINKLFTRNEVTVLDGSVGQTACVTNGVSAIEGGTGIADMTLAAPSKGDVATIRIDSITSGDVVVTCAEGVTFDGTNDKATFDAAGETLVLAYKNDTTWQVVMNIGGVTLDESST